jgi:hypothetical protein
MSAEITRDEINSLPHFGKIAFAARCARLVWDRPAPTQWQNPPAEFEKALQAAERWGGNREEWSFAVECVKKELHLLNKEELTIWTMVNFVRRNPGPSDQVGFGRALAAAITAAVNAAISEYEDKDDATTRYALGAYEKADQAAERGRCGSFASTIRDDFDYLAEHIKTEEDRFRKSCPPAHVESVVNLRLFDPAIGPEFFTDPRPPKLADGSRDGT